MQTNVFANDREICSKAADGVCSAAFPDVCWSPPGPPAGPVPIPYPNTAFARDLTNGTKTVFICNTEVAQKDKSYLAASTGDEPATFAFQKGINTGALKGKAYFASWSMNVKAEGLNVARHQDRMTHNHASPGGNTPPQVYFDDASGRARRACQDELKRIEKACKPEEDDDPNDKTQGLRKARRGFLRKLRARFEAMAEKVKAKGFQRGGNNAWIEDHCDALWVKPSTRYLDDIKNFAQQLGDIKTDLAGIVESIVKPLVEKLSKELLEKLAKEGGERGAKLAARAGARWAVGTSGAAVAGVGAVVTEAIATAWNIYDLGSTAWEGYQLGQEIYSTLSQIEEIMGDFDKTLGQLDQIFKNAANNPQAAVADAMGVFARLNACTRARRCILVPYNNTGTVSSLAGNGCCPGQTGHHVLPHEMTKGGECPGYTKGSAPTVCVEGVNNTHGTHGMIHRSLKKMMDDYRNGWFGENTTLSYGKARDLGVKSIQRTFPESKCSEACLRAQLDAYYKCNKPLPAVAGTTETGTALDEEPGTSN
jgi:hypothetical protein